MSNFSIGADTKVSSPEIIDAVNEITRTVQLNLAVNDFIHLLVGSDSAPTNDGNSRLTIERLAHDAWSLELILSKPFGAKTLGLPTFFGWLEPEEESWGRRLVGPHKTFMEVTHLGLSYSILQAVELITLYEQLFDDVRLWFLEDPKSLSEDFAKGLRGIARSRSNVGGFANEKVRKAISKGSGDWRMSLPNLFPDSELHFTRESLAATKAFALMATFDSTGLPRTIFYIQNKGKNFKSISVFRWNGLEFVPTSTELFSTFCLPKDYSTSRSSGPHFVSFEMLDFFFPEVSARLGLEPNGPEAGSSD